MKENFTGSFREWFCLFVLKEFLIDTVNTKSQICDFILWHKVAIESSFFYSFLISNDSKLDHFIMAFLMTKAIGLSVKDIEVFIIALDLSGFSFLVVESLSFFFIITELLKF